MRGVFPYYGGKHYIAREIISYFPNHRTFVDVFGGAGNIILNKPQSPVEVYNDLNDEVVNFFRVLRDHKEKLIEKLKLTPCSRKEFLNCLEPSDDPIEQARRTFVKQFQGWSGKQVLTPGNWSYSVSSVSRGISATVAHFYSGIENLDFVVNRMRMVQIECLDFRDIIKRYDTPETLFYNDPPYLHESRTNVNCYAIEMTEEDHLELFRMLSEIKGMAIVSGYDSEIYNKIYGGWYKKTIKTSVNSNNKRKSAVAKREEVIWANFPLEPHGQATLL